MNLRIFISALFLMMAVHKVNGQANSPEHLDTLVNEFVQGLRAQKVDTICVYEDYFIGGYTMYKHDADWCNADYFYKPVYIIWVQQGKTYLTERDNCFDYSTTIINAENLWRLFFQNEVTIKDEKVRPFQYATGNGISSVREDHSGHQNLKIFVGKDSIEIFFDGFYLQPKDNDGNVNMNYEYNTHLKNKELIDEFSRITARLEKEEVLTKHRR